ncbi:hypothetical protein GCM10007971_13120 [Oceanobacillus indicireducens]|uniref:Uncharacterized protein n=1 Tax=Oceanobacillus indicireducens TaxID=1004261 RepID=A0A917XVC1_9BACI|nr:hypothetical protein GCM10007971_13120 [Oceanobacillus indicireducens]
MIQSPSYQVRYPFVDYERGVDVTGLFNSILEQLSKFTSRVLKWYEPFWDFLVRHDKYVYLILLIMIFAGILF